MANTLVEKVRFAVSAENDDFFRDATIVEYLNRAQDRIVSHLITMEDKQENGRAVRGLDLLRNVIEITTFPAATPQSGYNVTQIDLSGEDPAVKEIIYVGFLPNTGSPIRIKELNNSQHMLLDWGNIVPSSHEGYYYVKGNDQFDLYTASAPTDTIDTLQVHVINQPQAITDETLTLAGLPERLESAVIYGACEMMAIQEQRENTANFAALYEEELTLTSY